jgi:GNAT superfamily N-acetyltransferase
MGIICYYNSAFYTIFLGGYNMCKIDSLLFKPSQYRDPTFFSLDSDFLDNDANSEFGYKKFEGHILIDGISYEDDKDDPDVVIENTIENIAAIDFHAYNLANLGFDYFNQDWSHADKHSKLVFAMDVDSADTELCHLIFKRGYTKTASAVPFEKWQDMTFAITEGYLITLDRVYIKPEYRKQGIGQYIYENLFKILYTEFNIVPLFAVGFCVPDKGEPENMLEVQKKLLKNNGFNVYKCNNETAFCKFIYDNDFMVAVSR